MYRKFNPETGGYYCTRVPGRPEELVHGAWVAGESLLPVPGTRQLTEDERLAAVSGMADRALELLSSTIEAVETLRELAGDTREAYASSRRRADATMTRADAEELVSVWAALVAHVDQRCEVDSTFAALAAKLRTRPANCADFPMREFIASEPSWLTGSPKRLSDGLWVPAQQWRSKHFCAWDTANQFPDGAADFFGPRLQELALSLEASLRARALARCGLAILARRPDDPNCPFHVSVWCSTRMLVLLHNLCNECSTRVRCWAIEGGPLVPAFATGDPQVCYA